MKVNENIDSWVVIGSEPGLRQLAFQRVAKWVPPRWLDPVLVDPHHRSGLVVLRGSGARGLASTDRSRR
jgi:hypothetical protein